MLESLPPLRAREAMLRGELGEVREAIRALQALCQHDWQETGHSHRDVYWTCKHCGRKRIGDEEVS